MKFTTYDDIMVSYENRCVFFDSTIFTICILLTATKSHEYLIICEVLLGIESAVPP